MISFFSKTRTNLSYRIISSVASFLFIFNFTIAPTITLAQSAETVLDLPAPGTMVKPSETYQPVLIKGLTVIPNEPFKFDFVVDTGDSGLTGEALEIESTKIIKYFLAALTVPEEDMWVNLSPYEEGRVIPPVFGETEMGRDLLAADYILKQLTATLMYPEDQIGKNFWDEVYSKAKELFGTTNIPLNTFNKVWIVPEKAEIFEKDQTALILDSKLKIMLEEDYVALQNNMNNSKFGMKSMDGKDAQEVSQVSSQAVRDVLIPAVEKEINEGKNFASLRQIYNSVILASWYKQALKDSILAQVYANQGKTAGVNVDDDDINNKIYDQYVDAFKKGVYSYIKQDVDPVTKQKGLPRKYFSGGADLTHTKDKAMISTGTTKEIIQKLPDTKSIVQFARLTGDTESVKAILPVNEISNFDKELAGSPGQVFRFSADMTPAKGETENRLRAPAAVTPERLASNIHNSGLSQQTKEDVAKSINQTSPQALVNFLNLSNSDKISGFNMSDLNGDQVVGLSNHLSEISRNIPDIKYYVTQASRGSKADLFSSQNKASIPEASKILINDRNVEQYSAPIQETVPIIINAVDFSGDLSPAKAESLIRSVSENDDISRPVIVLTNNAAQEAVFIESLEAVSGQNNVISGVTASDISSGEMKGTYIVPKYVPAVSGGRLVGNNDRFEMVENVETPINSFMNFSKGTAALTSQGINNAAILNINSDQDIDAVIASTDFEKEILTPSLNAHKQMESKPTTSFVNANIGRAEVQIGIINTRVSDPARNPASIQVASTTLNDKVGQLASDATIRNYGTTTFQGLEKVSISEGSTLISNGAGSINFKGTASIPKNTEIRIDVVPGANLDIEEGVDFSSVKEITLSRPGQATLTKAGEIRYEATPVSKAINDTASRLGIEPRAVQSSLEVENTQAGITQLKYAIASIPGISTPEKAEVILKEVDIISPQGNVNSGYLTDRTISALMSVPEIKSSGMSETDIGAKLISPISVQNVATEVAKKETGTVSSVSFDNLNNKVAEVMAEQPQTFSVAENHFVDQGKMPQISTPQRLTYIALESVVPETTISALTSRGEEVKLATSPSAALELLGENPGAILLGNNALLETNIVEAASRSVNPQTGLQSRVVTLDLGENTSTRIREISNRNIPTAHIVHVKTFSGVNISRILNPQSLKYNQSKEIVALVRTNPSSMRPVNVDTPDLFKGMSSNEINVVGFSSEKSLSIQEVSNMGNEISFVSHPSVPNTLVAVNANSIKSADDLSTKIGDSNITTFLVNNRATKIDKKEIPKVSPIVSIFSVKGNNDFAMIGRDEASRILNEKPASQANQIGDHTIVITEGTQEFAGIDLNSAMLSLKVQKDGNGVVLPMDQQSIKDLDIQGLTPVITDIEPIIAN